MTRYPVPAAIVPLWLATDARLSAYALRVLVGVIGLGAAAREVEVCPTQLARDLQMDRGSIYNARRQLLHMRLLQVRNDRGRALWRVRVPSEEALV